MTRVSRTPSRFSGFDTFMPTYQFLKALTERTVPDLQIDNEHLMIISPDEGAMGRAVYFANILGVDMGMFYKRRDYSTVVNGKKPDRCPRVPRELPWKEKM